jgi:hypothetical protein
LILNVLKKHNSIYAFYFQLFHQRGGHKAKRNRGREVNVQAYPLAGLQLMDESEIQRVSTQAVPPRRMALEDDIWP